eukprot:TRINITY_DN71_c0_g1_i1.p1 TRINITY_DN71_c0_g1~~TRINITY_DN71_c0_g1_i1.p1  ORF type:complete len:723 (+),score=40.19 TRINITY_DN71_c0_g1_i1:100-2169(+)
MNPFIILILIFSSAVAHSPISAKITREIFNLLANYKKGTSECTKKAVHMFNRFMTDDSMFATLLYTGKGLNDLGDYKRCNESPQNRYIFLQVNGLIAPLALGICGPIECSEKDYYSLKEPLSRMLNKVVNENNNTSSLNHKFVQEEIDFVDPIKRENSESLITPISVLGLICLLAFIIMNLVGLFCGVLKDLKERPNTMLRILKCFDISKNLKAIFTVTQNAHQDLKIFNGVRVLSMFWVILGHTFFHAIKAYPPNIFDASDFFKKFAYSYILSAPFSVDVFFFLSGFLAAYFLLHEIFSSHGKLPLFHIYLHRILRIFPLFLATFLIFCFVLPFFGTGPGFYNYYNKVNIDCKDYWHMTLFFVNNFAQVRDDCISHTWYIANDMQFFILTPVLIYVYYKRRLLGYILLATLASASALATFIIVFHYDLSPSYTKFSSTFYVKHYFEQYYNVPYTRINPYLLGVLAAYLYFEYKSGQITFFTKLTRFIQISTWFRYTLYLVSAGITFGLIHVIYWFNTYPEEVPEWVEKVYLVLAKPLFVVCMFGILYPAMIGKARIVRGIFGNGVFVPLARVTFGAYLIHPPLMIFMSLDEKKGSYFDYNGLLLKFLGYLVTSYCISFLLSAVYESPVICLDKEFLRPKAKKRVESKEKGDLVKGVELNEVSETSALTKSNQQLLIEKQQQYWVQSQL